MGFDGFISYSHAADGRLAPAVQRGLHRLAKPWHRRRALWIFRDQTGLAVTPGLWTSIQAALDGSEYFVLLASPEAARSPWVNREIEHWVGSKSAGRILPVVTDGVWRWDPAARDFSADSTAVPAALRGVFAEEPLYLDLRWARDDLQLSLRHSRFRDAIAQLAAPMHGVSKDELEGEDVRQHRRVRRLWSVGVASLVVLALVASLTGVLAVRNANRANVEAAEAQRQQLVAAEQRGSAERFAEEAREQEEVARQQEARAKQAGDEARRQEQIAGEQKGVAERASVEASRQQENARRQQGIADAAAARAGEQERSAREQRAAAGRAVAETARQREIAQRQQRLAEEAAAVTRRQEEIARDAQRLAEDAAVQARKQKEIAQEHQRLAEDATRDASEQKANAEEQRRIAIARRVNNRAKAMAPGDTRLALMLGVAATKVQPDDETRRHLAGLVTSTHYAGTLEKTDAVGYVTDDVLLARASDGVLKLWNVANRAVPTLLANLGPYDNWAISPDGRTITAARVLESVVFVWDVRTPTDPKQIGQIKADANVASLTFSRDGRTLFIGTDRTDGNDTGDLWDLSNPRRPKPLATRFESGASTVAEAAFSPDGKTLVTRHGDSSAGVWDLTDPAAAKFVTTLAETLRTDRGTASVQAIAFLRDLPILVVGGASYTWLVDLSKPAEPARKTLIAYTVRAVTSIIVSSDDRRLVITDNGSVTLIDLVGTDFLGHRTVDSWTAPNGIGSTALSPDGQTITTTGQDMVATAWNVAPYGAPQSQASLTDDRRQGLAAAFTPDGRLMLTVGPNPQAAVWDMTGRAKPVRRATPTVHDAPIYLAAATPDGRVLATADRDGRVRVSDITDPAQPGTIAEFVQERAWHGMYDELVISPDGTKLALGHGFGTVVLWDVTRGRAPKRLGPLAGAKMPVAFSPDGHTFIARDDRGPDASMWTLDGPAGPVKRGPFGSLGHDPDFPFHDAEIPIGEIAFSQDGRTVALGSRVRIGLWGVSQGRPQQSGTFTNPGNVASLVFSRDGRTLAATSREVVRLWDVADPADARQVGAIPVVAPEGLLQTARFSPDGRTLVTSEASTGLAGTDPTHATAMLWDLSKLAELRADPSVQACVMAGRGLTEDEWARYLPELEYQGTCSG